MTASITSRADERPRAVVHQDDRAVGGQRGESGATESLRSRPAGHDRRAGSPVSAASNAGGLSAIVGRRGPRTTWATSGWASERPQRAQQHGHAGRSDGTAWGARRRAALPCPAATTTTPTSRGKRAHQLLDVVEPDQRDARRPAPRSGTSRRPGGSRAGPPRASRRSSRAAGPDLATEADLAEEDARRPVRAGCGGCESSAAATARSAPGSVSRTPAVTCTKTSRSAKRGSAPGARAPRAARRAAWDRARWPPAAACRSPTCAASACTSTSTGRVPSISAVTALPLTPSAARGQEHRRRIGHRHEALLRHREHAELVDRAEPILGGAEQPVVERGLALEVEHGVDDVLEGLGPGDAAALGDVAHHEHRGARSPSRSASAAPAHSRTWPTLPGALSSVSV